MTRDTPDGSGSSGIYVANAGSPMPISYSTNVAAFGTELAGSEKLDVSVEHLDNVQKWCKDLAEAIKNDFLPNLDYVHSMLKLSSGSSPRSSLGSSDIDGVQDLVSQIEKAYGAVQQSMKAIGENLDQTGTAVKNIADKYTTVEERNQANAGDLGSAATS
jgi:hypothetical protein